VFKIIETDREPGLVLENSGEKILNDTQAWQVAHTKWETIRETSIRGNLIADGGVNTCGLCTLYFYGHSNTPYEEYQLAVKTGDLAAALLAAEREIKFLIINQ
jgi:hypothetical protein